jgi:hypothetical protein
MRYRLILAGLLASCVAGPLAAQVRLLEAGIYCVSPRTGEQVEAPDTVAGVVHTIVGEPFDVIGRVVPLQQGLSFGIRTELKASDPLTVRMALRHPPMVDNEGQTGGSYTTTLPARASHVRSFTFDYAYEMVPGRWTMEIWDQDELLLSVGFDVVNHPVAAVDDACQSKLQA